MDGFTGYKTAAAETLPDAITVMDPFHAAVTRAMGTANMFTGQERLSEKQQARLGRVLANEAPKRVETTWRDVQ